MPAPTAKKIIDSTIKTFFLAALMILSAALLFPKAAHAALGFVGNMFPVGGSHSNLTEGNNFTVYLQVWKDGVTNSPGAGANITCSLYWGQVPSFGGTWSNITTTPMSYNTDNGNNDEYMATISPTAGLYEFTGYCTDTTDATTTWQGSGNGQLTVNAPVTSCSGATTGDNNIFWDGLLHDSFSTAYRAPTGPVTTDQGTVTLKFRTCQNDVGSANLRIWDDYADSETILPLAFDSNATEPGVGNVTYWTATVPISTDPTIFYYVFSATDGTATVYYRDDAPKFYGGGYGAAEGSQTTAYDNSYQLTIYDPNFYVPSWMTRGIVYQIFPDRFRDGNPANNPTNGRFSYDLPGGAIVRSGQTNWNYTVCDPRSTYAPSCANHYGDNFYGGDLAGITEKINAGYFDSLGITVLYLNPIFRSPSNHKYDTADYLTIDPDFGTLADFQAMVAAADAHGIQIILDGVFNHVSSDSKYFDRYSRYDSAGNLISPGIGTDDQSGACESPLSPFRAWFYIPDAGSPATGPTDRCDAIDGDDPGGVWTETYSAWYGYGSLPKLQANSPDVRDLIWADGGNSVGPYWIGQGADGWRFDVGGDVDPGVTNDPANDYWEGFRTAVRVENSDALTLGEEWGDASAWLLGNEWDSVMNYRFRSAVLSWLFTGCSGNGCTGGVFEDNDSNSGSSSGAISYISPSQFNARLLSIQEDYPPMAWKAMMNLEGSHDTNRVRFLLKKINNDNDSAAAQRMKEWWLFSYTYAGAPTLYYGDEIGLNHDGVWSSAKWEDDPYNRVPFPWSDTPGSYTADTTNLLPFARQMASIRHSYRALQDGDVQHGLIIDDANKLYGFARTNSTQTALIALNRDSASHTASFTGLNAAPYSLHDGTVLVDALNGGTYTVTGGAVTPSVNPAWGVILLEQTEMDSPEPANVSMTANLAQVILTWPQVTLDTNGQPEVVTNYEVWRSVNANFSDATKIADVPPPAFGSTDNLVTFIDETSVDQPDDRPSDFYYRVVAVNGAGVPGAESNQVGASPTAVVLTRLTVRPSPWVLGVISGAVLGLVFIGGVWWRGRRLKR
ncbi:MAG: glycoside hydrolase family 13 protein [Anaerolineales bacterium]|nr:glycoside hydrolase family 13 protein [Anaerolineales bacterium]